LQANVESVNPKIQTAKQRWAGFYGSAQAAFPSIRRLIYDRWRGNMKNQLDNRVKCGNIIEQLSA